MDTTVTGIGAVVVAELRAAGYMESTIGQYEKTIKALAGFAEERGGVYTPVAGCRVRVDDGQSAHWPVQRTAPVRLPPAGQRVRLLRADRPGGLWRSVNAVAGVPQPESGEFAALGAAWEADMADRGLAPATRDAYGRVARGYLVFLESRGSTVSMPPMAPACWGFSNRCRAGGRSRRCSGWCRTSARSWPSPAAPIWSTRPAWLVSDVPTRSCPFLATTIERLVLQACASEVVSARDAAITLLALTTGLRACDIVGLRLGDIDWRARTAEIVQQKTGNPLTVPLTAWWWPGSPTTCSTTGPTRPMITCSCVARPHTPDSPVTRRSTG